MLNVRSVSSDFDYYSLSLYGAYYWGSLSLVADLNYSALDNEVTGSSYAGELHSDFDSSNFNVGLTAQYRFDVGALQVSPHVGVRYTHLSLHAYMVTGAGGDIGSFDSSSVDFVSVPLGVTVSSSFAVGEWLLQPAVDLTVTVHMGDDSIDGSYDWTGVDNLFTALESEVINDFSYGAQVGFSAAKDSLSFGLELGYTGSSNVDEIGVQFSANYAF